MPHGDETHDGRAGEPQTWHHGLIARWWAEFNTSGPEIAYFQRLIEENGQPALDVACGTGRLLIPFLHAGLDVDGCDLSEDMLAQCRARADREGLSPSLFAQPVHRLDLPRSYRTIVFCGGFGLGGRRPQDMQALRRLYEHLDPGGLLAMDNEVPYNDTRTWPYWTKDDRANLPEQETPATGRGRRTSDGSELELGYRVLDVDPLEQRIVHELRAWLRRDGELLAEERHVLGMTVYFTDEIRLMLDRAGFTDIELRGDYTDDKPAADSKFVVFLARKPA